MVASRWKSPVFVVAVFFLFVLLKKSSFHNTSPQSSTIPTRPAEPPTHQNNDFHWSNVPQRYPVTSIQSLPVSVSGSMPEIQHVFPKETSAEKAIRLSRLEAVKGNFTHAWSAYKQYAWLHDEVKPISNGSQDPFGGWAATLVDSLDTLWIMNLHTDFKEAVEAITSINFHDCALDELNIFETTIRYLGGFLSAYDLSGGKYPLLLEKATEMGDMLYKAFDTPNRLPVMRWNFKDGIKGVPQVASNNTLVSEIGSLSLEFTRLSQVTGNMKYFDAIQRVMDQFEDQQANTKLPGMWPIVVNAKNGDFTGYTGFTIGGMADSLYEYLPKQHMLLGGATQQYRRMYDYSMTAIKRNIFFRPMTKGGEDIRLAGQVDTDGKTPVMELKIDPEAQHLGCFAGGMVAIAGKIFENDADLELGKKLVEGCLWGYDIMPLGVMPEIMHTIPCKDVKNCPWDEKKWLDQVNQAYDGEENVEVKVKKHHLPPGVVKVDDPRYILRPEAIESIFILYRITGDQTLRERAWNMFNNIIKHTLTEVAHAGLDDCTVENPPKSDRMESFWLAETLKYFYLIFEEESVVNLDEYVLNTEAHAFKRPK
ncbi:glycoside hydrolase family 47 protein [Tricladium varicosporioides]|nr:glycoside hydrolase family 47 protein [Hymenoscyphus varicosporioides]